MENNITKKQNAFISEEEKTLNWEEIQASFKKTFGSEIYLLNLKAIKDVYQKKILNFQKEVLFHFLVMKI